MSIAAANLTRAIFTASSSTKIPRQQSRTFERWVALIVKAGRAGVHLSCRRSTPFNCNAGGIWIIQTLPPVMLGAYTRWFNSWALLRVGPSGPYRDRNGHRNPLDATFPLAIGGHTFPGYTAVYTCLESGRRGRADAVFNAMSSGERRRMKPWLLTTPSKGGGMNATAAVSPPAARIALRRSDQKA